ncbi:MAG: hypothetical protein HRT87_02860 [Legionellales bacterium]|nr:hypothetical protein [Legionellales bacterium]
MGTYGFWDIRRIKDVSKKIHQLTIGIEYLTQHFETRFNGYLPQNKRFLFNTSAVRKNPVRLTRNYNATTGNTTQTVDYNADTVNKYQIPLAGFDFEIGSNFFNKFETHVAYYHFNGRKGAKSVNGWRMRGSIYVYNQGNQRFDIQGEVNYDNVRKWSNYLGIKFTWALGNKNNKIIRNSLDDKMTIRDVDVIANSSTEILPSNTIISQFEETAGFAIAALGQDEIKTLGLKNATIEGNAIHTKWDTDSEINEVIAILNTNASNNSYNLMGKITQDGQGNIKFLPLINSKDNSINIEVSNEIAKLFSLHSGYTTKQIEQDILANTAQQQQAYINSYKQGKINKQSASTVSLTITKNIIFKDINKYIYRNPNRTYRATSEDLRNDECAVYGEGYYRVPIVITDPQTRWLDLPDTPLSFKMSNTVFNKLPQAIKDKIKEYEKSHNINIDINNIEIIYASQNLTFGSDAEDNPDPNNPAKIPLNANEPARIRYHAYDHNDSPQNTIDPYSRTSLREIYVMPINGNTMTPIANGTDQSTHTHSFNNNDNHGNLLYRYNVWSPRNSGNIPDNVYYPTNRTPASTRRNQPPGAFYSLGIQKGTPSHPSTGKQVIITYHQILEKSDLIKMEDINTHGKNIEKLKAKLNTYITGVTHTNNNYPGIDNTHNFISNITPFAKLNGISYTNNRFEIDI